MGQIESAQLTSNQFLRSMINLSFSLIQVLLRNNWREAYPELTGVSVEIDLPAQVAIHIEEKEPLFAWKHNEDVLWIDAFGSIFPPRGDADLIFTIESEEPPPLMITHSDQTWITGQRGEK